MSSEASATTHTDLELDASKLNDALKKVKTSNNNSNHLLKYCEADEEGFCQGFVELSKNGWKKMRLNALCVSVVSTTTMANNAQLAGKKQEEWEPLKGTVKLDHRGLPREVAVFIAVVTKTRKRGNVVETMKLRKNSHQQIWQPSLV